MPNPMEILETGVTIGTSTSTGTAAAPAFDCAYPANFTGATTFTGGVSGVNKIRIGNTDYIIQIGTSGAAGYLTFVLEE